MASKTAARKAPVSNRRRRFNQIVLTIRRDGEKLLDAAVRNFKTLEAQTIINAGVRRQLAYLVSSAGLSRVGELLASGRSRVRLVDNLVNKLRRTGQLSRVDRAVIEARESETDRLIAKNPAAKVSYLIETLGAQRTEQLLSTPVPVYQARKTNPSDR